MFLRRITGPWGSNSPLLSALDREGKTIMAPIRKFLALCALSSLSACCGEPTYTPSFWNDGGQIQYNNNCYNYSNNKRTDTFAQPGRAAGAMYTNLSCTSVGPAAAADGVDSIPATGACNRSWLFWRRYDKLALVVAPGWDYHWYRQDSNGMWTHKPGGTQATNLDNLGNPISNPETAARGPYVDFCGYYCSCSSSTEGAGNENIQ